MSLDPPTKNSSLLLRSVPVGFQQSTSRSATPPWCTSQDPYPSSVFRSHIDHALTLKKKVGKTIRSYRFTEG